MTVFIHAAPCARPGAKKRFGLAFFQRVTADPTRFRIITARFGFGAVLESPTRAKSDPVSSRNARFSFRLDPTAVPKRVAKVKLSGAEAGVTTPQNTPVPTPHSP